MTTMLVVLLALGGVKAQPCRPTVACTAELVPEGHVEVELGALATPGVSSVNVLTKVSLVDWLQVQLGSDGLLVKQGEATSAVDGAVMVLKARLLQQREVLPTLSLSVRAALPTRTPLPALQATVDLGGTLHVSKDVGPAHLDLNATVLVAGLTRVQGQAALALSGSVTETLGAALELHSTFGSALANDGGLRGVLTWSPAPQLVFDVGADLGLYRETRAWSFFAGVVFVPSAS